MQHELTWPAVFFLLSILAVWGASFLLQLYGAYEAFKKKWYLGAVALLIPGFALVVGAAKLFFKKDLLK